MLLLGSLAACTGDPRAPVPPRASAAPSASAAEPSASPTIAAQGEWRPDGTIETRAADLGAPWSVVSLPDGSALVSGRDDATVREIAASGEVREVGAVDGVSPGGEGGLLGLAVRDVDGALWLYAYITAAEDNRVVRMELVGDSGERSLGAPQTVLSGIAKAGNHNGGRLAFGPDGYLYIGTGDASDSGLSQDPESLNGKILRVTAAGDPAPGNPFGTAVFSLGHRNVQGLAWTADGEMWASEFGQNAVDELNRIEAGGNYGWPIHEGTAAADGFVDPVITWPTSDASPSGIAAVGDTVFVAALRGQRLWAVDTTSSPAVADAYLIGEQGRLRDAVAATDGSLWLLTNNTDGRGSPRPSDDLLLRIGLQPSG